MDPPGGPDGQPAFRMDIDAASVAAAPDGSLLVADSHGLIRRIGVDNMVVDVAGRNPFREPPADAASLQADIGQPRDVVALDDGAFAFSAPLTRVWPDARIRVLSETYGEYIAALPDGSFLYTEQQYSRVTRLWPDGRVSRFAGTGKEGSSGDGLPATQARLNIPAAVTAMPDGSVLIADEGSGRIRRVDEQGYISTAARVRIPRDVAAAADGGFYVTAADGLRRFSANGSPLAVYTLQTFGVRDQRRFDGRVLHPSRITVMGDGNLAFTAQGGIWLLGLTPLSRLAVSIRGLEVGPSGVTATIASTGAGTLALSSDRALGAAKSTVEIAEGVHRISLPGPFRSAQGTLTAEVTDDSGRVAGDRIDAWLGERLPMQDARNLAWDSLVIDSGESYTLKRCRRVSERAVDCPFYDSFNRRGKPRRCSHVVSISLPRSGIPEYHSYRCRKGRSPFRPR
jgi:hypothetical protein